MPIQLTAPGGDVTVGRTTASYVYGSFTVRFPEGTTQQEADTRIQNAFIYRPDNRSTGRFDVSFVRADATVDLAANTSDFETILEAAQKRVEGDTFFEQDLLVFGRLRPGVDFKIGDIAHVSRWGKQIPAPVTACDVVVDDQHRRGWRVHVGGQMVQDAAARKASNDQILQQIAQERQQRLRDVGAVDSKASTAQSTAEDAKQSAIDALAQQQADFQAFQVERDAQQDAYMEALRAVQEASIRPVQGWLFLTTASASTAENQYLRINHSSRSSGTRSVEMLGSWVGKIIVTRNGTTTKYDGNSDSYDDSFTNMTEYAVPLPDGQRIITGSHTTSATFVRVDYEVSPGVQQSRQLVQQQLTLPQSSWTELTSLTWAAPKQTDFMGLVKVNFAAVPFLPWYGVRVTINGTTYKEQLVNHLGPLLGNGPRTLYIQINGVTLNSGDEIKVLAYSDAGTTGDRAISLATMDISWIE